MFTQTTTGRTLSGLFCEINLTLADVQQAFGTPRSDAFYEPERGYDGNEWFFRSEVTGEVVSLYSRWGSLRIGASPNTGPQFVAWLTEHFSKIRCFDFDLEEYQARMLAHAEIQAQMAAY